MAAMLGGDDLELDLPGQGVREDIGDAWRRGGGVMVDHEEAAHAVTVAA